MPFKFAPKQPSPARNAPIVDIADRAMALAPHLPCDPFTEQTFLDHAIGLNAVTTTAEADQLRTYLAEVGVIVRHGEPSEMWVVG